MVSAVAENISNNPQQGPQQYAGGPFDFGNPVNSVLPVGDSGNPLNSPVSDKDISSALKEQRDRASELWDKGKEVSGKIDKQAADIEGLTPPKPPTIAPPTPPRGTDPWAVFGSPAMTLAIFGSMAIRGGINGALEAGAGVMQAQKDNDAAAAKKYMEDYKQYVDYVKQQHEFEKSFYEEGLEKAGKDINAQKASLEAMATSLKDTNLTALLQVKGMQGYYDEMKKRQGLMDKMDNANLELTATQEEKEKIAEEKAAGKKITPLQEQERLNQARILAHASITEDEAKTLGEKYQITNQMPPQGLGNSPSAQANRTLIMKYATIDENGKPISGKDMANKELAFKSQQSEARAQGTAEGKVEYAANLLDAAIPPAREAIKHVDLSNFKSINEFENYARTHTGDPNISALRVALQNVMTDYSNMIARNGTSTDATRSKAESLINEAMAKGQLDAAFNQMLIERGQVRKATEVTKKEMAGKPNIPPGAIQHLKDNPSLSADFDEKYGEGSAERILGGQ